MQGLLGLDWQGRQLLKSHLLGLLIYGLTVCNNFGNVGKRARMKTVGGGHDGIDEVHT
jgi:hypothetical protein